MVVQLDCCRDTTECDKSWRGLSSLSVFHCCAQLWLACFIPKWYSYTPVNSARPFCYIWAILQPTNIDNKCSSLFVFGEIIFLRQGRGETTPTAYFYQNLGEAEYVVAVYQYMRLLGYPAEKVRVAVGCAAWLPSHFPREVLSYTWWDSRMSTTSCRETPLRLFVNWYLSRSNHSFAC